MNNDILESASIDKEAHKAASSPKNSLPEPTEAQKESGNYKKGHVSIQGLEIAIENPAGSERSGIGADGKKWTSKMSHHYGYIKGTEGRDKDHLDVFLGPDPENCKEVFIVNQIGTKTGDFDEHKIMLGFGTMEEAKEAYLANYEKGWQGCGSVVTMSMDEFKDWLKNGNTKEELSPIPRKKDIFGEEIPLNGWIGVDFDGTIAKYDGWNDGKIGEPIALMLDFVKKLISDGAKVKIFTARASDPMMIPPIKEWCKKHGLPDIEITNVKDPDMVKLYDDRATKVIPNTGIVLESADNPDWRKSIHEAKTFEDIEKMFKQIMPRQFE
jgi:hypothetical protein